MTSQEPISRTYRFAMAACTPIVRWWGRLEVSGAEHLPTSGPTLVVGNHDSHWDPVAIGIAGPAAIVPMPARATSGLSGSGSSSSQTATFARARGARDWPADTCSRVGGEQPDHELRR